MPDSGNDSNATSVRQLSVPPLPDSLAEKDRHHAIGRLFAEKHREFDRLSRFYRNIAILTRLAAVLAAVLVPFLMSSQPRWAQALSLVVVVAVALDLAMRPQQKAALYSRATYLLLMADLKRAGDFTRYESQLRILVETDAAELQQIGDLQTLLKQVEARR